MYATDNNTMRVIVSRKDMKRNSIIRKTEFIIWRTAETRFNDLMGDKRIFVLGEIYRRLRKIPEYDGSVAILFAQSEYAICKRLKMEQAEFDDILHGLIENEVVNVVYSTLEYKVLSLDRSIFLANYVYYKESGTDSKECADFSMKYEVKAER